jgi:hypothetical protein
MAAHQQGDQAEAEGQAPAGSRGWTHRRYFFLN